MHKKVIWTLSGVAAVGLVGTGVAAWALTQAPPAAAPANDATIEGIAVDLSDVPALYTGDELEWLLPEDDALVELFGVNEFHEIEAAYGGTGEREGITARPEECDPFLWEDFTRVIGQRNRAFAIGAGFGNVRVMQFGTGEIAQEWAAARLSASGGCETYEVGLFYEGGDGEVFNHYTHTQLATSVEGDAAIVVDLLDVAETGEWDIDTVEAVMVHGNTVMVLFAMHDPAEAFDADKLVDVLKGRVAYAQEQLVDSLR